LEDQVLNRTKELLGTKKAKGFNLGVDQGLRDNKDVPRSQDVLVVKHEEGSSRVCSNMSCVPKGEGRTSKAKTKNNVIALLREFSPSWIAQETNSHQASMVLVVECNLVKWYQIHLLHQKTEVATHKMPQRGSFCRTVQWLHEPRSVVRVERRRDATYPYVTNSRTSKSLVQIQALSIHQGFPSNCSLKTPMATPILRREVASLVATDGDSTGDIA
ncbi:hypothetical protein CR513_35655, partial [Mucuna pruriens]